MEKEILPTHDYFDFFNFAAQEGIDEDQSITDWWTKQFIIMFAGVLCGIAANAFLRGGNSVLKTGSVNFITHLLNKTKMVFLVRTDIPMGKGKMASQVAHAAILCYQAAQARKSEHLSYWEQSGQMKVVLKCSDEEEMDRLFREATEHGLTTSIVRDAGRTQIPSGTKTVIGIGPGPIDVIDQITGHLKLY